MRVFVANLDCEVSWARASSPGPHKALPPAVRRAVSEFSQPLRALARNADHFFTLADLQGGLPKEVRDASEVLVWGQTSEAPSVPSPRTSSPVQPSPEQPWKERLWQLSCSPDIAAACNDRRFALGLELPDEVRLKDVRALTSLEELDTYLATAPLGPGEAWVAKAPWSASGREKLKRHGRVVEGEQRAFATRLLQRYGSLLVEPWMRRTQDFGVAGLVADSLEESLVFPPHQLMCDAGGVFRGIRVDDKETRARLGSCAEALDEAAWTSCRALHARGYRGAFGIDTFLYDDDGHERLRAVCEINARLSFGHVARAIAEESSQQTCDFSL